MFFKKKRENVNLHLLLNTLQRRIILVRKAFQTEIDELNVGKGKHVS